MPIWVSVGGFDAADYAASCARLDERPEVEALELNLSCPNVEEAAESAAEIVAACRAATSKPLYAKLSPALPQVPDVARAVAAAGADGLSLVNTIRGARARPADAPPAARDGRRRVLRARRSSRSRSPPSTPARRAVDLPIVGMGGVMTGEDALELIAAGATHVALGTVLFRDPVAPGRVRAELAAAAAERGFELPADERSATPTLDQTSRV